jgi:CHAD domain-containing protein
VIALARRWRATHGGWLDTVSKAERGWRLAHGRQFGEPRAAAQPDPQARSGREFTQAALHECLEQVLANASEVGAGSSDAEQVHQLRVGIRRLRTAMRELAALLPPAGAQWDTAWIRLFRELGRHRDRHYLAQLQLRLEAAGGPVLAIEADTGDPGTPATAVRSAAFQDALLVVLGLLHGSGIGQRADADAKQVKVLLAKRLGRLRKAVLADGKHFEDLPSGLQHRVRKRLKRLRYLAEFAQGLFPRKAAEEFIDALKPVQTALGDYNDELLALRHYEQWAAVEPRALFGAGWLGARRAINARACAQEVHTMAGVRPFWK